jgi:hypothetical protein
MSNIALKENDFVTVNDSRIDGYGKAYQIVEIIGHFVNVKAKNGDTASYHESDLDKLDIDDFKEFKQSMLNESSDTLVYWLIANNNTASITMLQRNNIQFDLSAKDQSITISQKDINSLTAYDKAIFDGQYKFDRHESMINESLSINGKVAYNDNQVSFKTNTVMSILQHLAWQYNDNYVATIKKMSNLAAVKLSASPIKSLSLNGTPLIFEDVLGETEDIVMSAKAQTLINFSYVYSENKKLTAYVDKKFLQFIVLLLNGTWYFVRNTEDNMKLFDKFDDFKDIEYNNLDLPTTKLPKIISSLDSINAAKNALKSYANDANLTNFNISTFACDQDSILQAKPTISKFSSFAPDINEFTSSYMNIRLDKDADIPYLIDIDAQQLILLVNKKWYMIDNELYVNLITAKFQNVFVDSVKNTLESTRLNKGLTAESIYLAVAKNRAIALLNGIQQEFTTSGYFYVSEYSKTLQAKQFAKVTINADKYATKIYNDKALTLFKDTIITFSANLKTGIVVIAYPTIDNTMYITKLEFIKELVDELVNTNAKLDTVVSISDIYFTDNKSKKK